MFKVQYPLYLKALDGVLSTNHKFLLSDSLSMYDFYIAGHFVNVVLNPKHALAEHWQKSWDNDVSDRIKQYVGDFKAEMQEYLDTREQCLF